MTLWHVMTHFFPSLHLDSWCPPVAACTFPTYSTSAHETAEISARLASAMPVLSSAAGASLNWPGMTLRGPNHLPWSSLSQIQRLLPWELRWESLRTGIAKHFSHFQLTSTLIHYLTFHFTVRLVHAQAMMCWCQRSLSFLDAGHLQRSISTMPVRKFSMEPEAAKLQIIVYLAIVW